MKKLSAAVLGGVLFLAAANPASPSTWKGIALQSKWKNAPFHFGPLRFNLGLVMEEMGYDSNVYGSALDPVVDFSLTAGPALTVYLPIYKRILISVDESPSYTYFRRTARERDWNNALNGQVYFLFNKFLISFSAARRDFKQRINAEIEIRPRLLTETFEASVLWQAAPKTSFSLGWNQTESQFENYGIHALSSFLNRRETRLDLTAFHQVSTKTMFFVKLEYGEYDFMNPESLLNSRGYAAHGGFEFSPTGKVRGKINLGYRRIVPKANQRSPYGGLVGDSGVSLKLFRSWTIRLSYRRDLPFSFLYENTYCVIQSLLAGSSFYVSKDIRFDMDYGPGRVTYPELRAASDPARAGVLFEDTFQYYSAGFFFRLKRNIGIGLTAAHWTRGRLDAPEGSSSRDSLFGRLTYDF